MNILVLNCGSSSLKFQIIKIDNNSIQTNSETELAKGLIEKVGSNDAIVSFKTSIEEDTNTNNTNQFKAIKPLADHKDALKCLIE